MVSEAEPRQDLERVISSACTGLLGDFGRLRGLFVEPHEEMDPDTVARNLMEFGRGQVSGIDQATAEDNELIDRQVSNISVDNEVGRQFCAYVSGCVLGWVLVDQLSRADLEPALDIVHARAAEVFPARDPSES